MKGAVSRPMIACFSMVRRSLSTFPFIVQFSDVRVDLYSTTPGSFADTAQVRSGTLGFGADDDFIALYDSGQLVAGF